MTFLENRIPPPIALLVGLLLMRLIALFDSSQWFVFEHRNWFALVFCTLGFGTAVSGVLSFKKADTTINPLEPERASQLVKTGVFRISRNPMYLGMVLVGVAWAFYLGSVFSLLMVVAFMLFITHFQIKPEERALAALYPEEFQQYCQTTRRWL